MYLKEVDKQEDDSFSGKNACRNLPKIVYCSRIVLVLYCYVVFVEEQLMNIILDVLSAGADTTANSIGMALPSYL